MIKWILAKLNTSELHTIKKVRRQATESEKMFINHISNQELVSRIYKELLQLSNMRMTQQKYCIKWKFPDGAPVRT